MKKSEIQVIITMNVLTRSLECTLNPMRYTGYVYIYMNVLTRSSEWIMNPMRSNSINKQDIFIRYHVYMHTYIIYTLYMFIYHVYVVDKRSISPWSYQCVEKNALALISLVQCD